MAVVELDTALFRELYPKYADASDQLVEAWWTVACQLIGNTESSRIPYNPPSVTVRKSILYAALCHVAELMTRGNSAVGRVSSASEGSVSTSFDYPALSKNGAWWAQTQCGALVWQMLLPYRSGGLYFRGGPKY